MTKYILVFLAGFVTAVYCLAPPLDQPCQSTHQQAGQLRPTVLKAVVWVIDRTVHLATDLAGRLWQLARAKARGPDQQIQPASHPSVTNGP